MPKKKPQPYEEWVPSDWTDWAPDPGEGDRMKAENPDLIRYYSDEELDKMGQEEAKRRS